MNYDAKIGAGEDAGQATAYAPFEQPDEEERRKTRRIWLIGALVVLALIGLWYLNNKTKDTGLADDTASQAPVVSVLPLGQTTIAGRIGATGTIAARREMPVGAVGEGGRVERVLVEPGQWVGAGQVLAIVDREVQTQQQASLAAQIQVAQADARLAQSNLDRALKLVARGFVSKADVDRLTATRDASNARVRVAQAQLSEMRARTSRLNITAPAAGLVLERMVEPGQVVSPGSGVLFRLARGGEMELLTKVSESDLGRITPGVSVAVTPVGTEKTFTGQVWQISPVINPQDRQGTVRVALAYAPELRPGGFASAEIASGSVVAPLLPETALLSDNKGSYVYIVGKDNKATRRPVKTGTITGNGVVVTEGLNGSELVVLKAGAFLADGETIRPKRVKPKQ